MTVDSYAFLPRAFRDMFEAAPQFDHEPVFADMAKPIDQATIGLLSSAGIHLRSDDAFDLDRERREPGWGDPTLRLIPNTVAQADIDAGHLHINTTDLLVDINVALPIERLNELVAAGRVGRAADEHFSVMGYQEDGAEVWRTETGPEIAARCREAEIDALILAPA